jgi:undecaprenyl-diphosphatase
MGSQLGVITPLLLILMIISVLKLRKDKEGSYLFWFSIPVLAFFLFKSIQAKVQANWALPGYITGIISFSAMYLRRFDTDGKGKKILVSTSLVLSLIMTSIAHYPSIIDLPAKLDPASRIQGWQALGEEVTRVYEQMSSANPVFIFSDKYQVSSELAFYVKVHPVTYCINLGRRMNQYDLWPGFNNLVHHNAIFVMIGDSTVPEKLAAAFDKVEKKIYTAYTKNHAKIRDYSIFVCYGFKGLREARPEAY